MMKKYIALGLALILSCAAYAQNKIKVACVGNSITYGSGVADREVNAYPVKLQGMLGDKYEVGNFGKPGATLLNKGHRPYTQQEEYKDALAFAGDIVVIHLGINDTDPRNWPNYRDEFIGDYRALMQSFREVNPKVRFLLARMTPLSDRHRRFESGTLDWHAEIQLAIECIAKAEEGDMPLNDTTETTQIDTQENIEGTTITDTLASGESDTIVSDETITSEEETTTQIVVVTEANDTPTTEKQVVKVWVPSSGKKYHSKSTCSHYIWICRSFII